MIINIYFGKLSLKTYLFGTHKISSQRCDLNEYPQHGLIEKY